MLKIVGLGPGDYNALTIGALNQLKKNKNIYFLCRICRGISRQRHSSNCAAGQRP